MASDIPASVAVHSDTDVPGSIGQRTLNAVLNMTVREAAIKVLALVGWIVLARALDPALFGLFALASFSVNLFNIFGEVGLGASLIRSQHDLPPRSLDALFSCQLACAVAVAIPVAISAPLLARYYGMPELATVVQALALALVIISLRTAPSVLLQRQLRYRPIALSDVVAQAAYWLVAILLALAGLGVWAIALAVVAFGVAGTGVLYARAGWRPRLHFDWSSMKGNTAPALMYHGQTLSSLAKYSMLVVVGGAAFGPDGVGYVTWAHQIAVVPALLTLLVSRVSFPALAQVQHHPEAFGGLLSSIVVWTCRLTFPACILLISLGSQVTEYIYGEKWLQALPSFYLFTLHTALWAPAAVLITALYSLGRGGQGFRILLGMILVAWLGAIASTYLSLGIMGLAVAYLLSTLVALVWAAYACRLFAGLLWLRAVALPFLGAAVLGVTVYLAAPALVHGVPSLVALAIVAGAAMLVVNLVGEYSRLLSYAKSWRRHLPLLVK